MNNYAKDLQQYMEQSVRTMTPGEMLILLYDELLKRLRKAKILADQKDFTAFEHEVRKCQDIVAYLTGSLDKQYPVSQNLSQLYDFFNYELIRLNAGRNTQIVDELAPFIAELRDTFRQADQLSRKR